MGVIGRTLKFTLGLLVGTVLGAAATMLVAPQSGKVTKDQIQRRVDEILKAGQDAQTEREKELLTYWEQQMEKK